MGIFDDKDDKTERATPKRKSDSRQKGKVAVSKELSMAALLIAAILVFELAGGGLVEALKQGLRRGLTVSMPEAADRGWAIAKIREYVFAVLPSLLPLVGTLMATGIIVGYAQAGFVITFEPIQPKLDKLNPAAGFGKLLSMRSLMTTGLAALKFALLALVLYANLSADWPLILTLPDRPFAESAPLVGMLALKILWWIAVPLAVLAIIDLFYQRWQQARDLRMSKQEVKDELKMTEGDPEIRARIRRAQREIARRRMTEEVPKADVVITNPTHYSIALKYERNKMNAPVVTAKGTDRVALHIRSLARDSGVPIVEDPPLARALYRGVRLGQEIPARFYEAVATILSHVFSTRRKGA